MVPNLPIIEAAEPAASTASFSAIAKDASGHSLGNLPCQKPPWESLLAVNTNTGDIVWSVPLGITEGLPQGKQNTGRTGAFAGPIATGGGLVFIGATNDDRFRAFDSKTGKELWSTKLDYAATAVPMTYEGKNGKQYVAIVDAEAVPGTSKHYWFLPCRNNARPRAKSEKAI